MGTLYLVATPIGNLEDITRRALRILSSAALVAAEDTRRTGKLLEHYGIRTRLVSYHEHNKLSRIEPILAALSEADVALVSDAGTPGLNDPGYELVRAVLEAGFPVSPVPGPSAPLAALVASGLPTDAFIYLGYLPRKYSERRRRIESVVTLPYTLIFLETPHRLLAALRDLLAIFGDRQIAAARELTKLHEEIFRGPISMAIAHFQAQEPRGEFTLIIAGAQPLPRWSDAELISAAPEALQRNSALTMAAAELAERSGRTRREIYRLLLELGVDQDKEPKDEPG